MKRGYPFTSGNLNYGYSYAYTPKSTSGGGGGGGSEGPAGPQGPKGPKGPKGSQGDPGPAGPPGPDGPKGPKGDTGPSGPPGPNGPNGPKGDTGPAGPQGQAGPRGPQGIQGPIGNTGPRGQPGTSAHKGEKGDPGPRGPKGPQGDTGPRGVPGTNGRDGRKGPRGDRGPPGSQGAQGIQGIPGPTGPKGATGASGPQGSTGATGPRGLKGETGIQGPRGPTGSKGPKGDQGPVGPTGPQGATGTFGGNVTSDINMSGHKLTGLPTPPTHDSDAVTKKWVSDEFPTKTEILDGFTMTGPLDLGGHKIYEVGTPTNAKDAANKAYVDSSQGMTTAQADARYLREADGDTRYLRRYGGVIETDSLGNIESFDRNASVIVGAAKRPEHFTRVGDSYYLTYIENNKIRFLHRVKTQNLFTDTPKNGVIQGLKDPVEDHEAARKKYVDDKNTVSHVATAADASDAIINKNALENSGLVGLNSLVPTLKGLLTTLQEQKFDANISLLVLKGAPGSAGAEYRIVHKDSSLVDSVQFRKVGRKAQLDVTFKKALDHGMYSYEFDILSNLTGGFDVHMYGECGSSGYNATSLYRYWAANFPTSNSGQTFSHTEQSNTSGGRFLRGAGKKVQVFGSFHYSLNTITNRGKPFSVNTDTTNANGASYEFMVQKLTLKPTANVPSILGSTLTFVIEPDGNHSINLEAESYFSISKNVTLTV